MKYNALPYWCKSRENDPFKYPLRSIGEIAFEQYCSPPNLPFWEVIDEYKETVPLPGKIDNRNNEVRLIIELDKTDLSPLQIERFKFLLGPRAKKKLPYVKIVSRNYYTKEENKKKAIDILRQIYLEAKRAPEYYTPMMTRKEIYNESVRLYGKTKEEREKNIKLKEEERIRMYNKFQEESRNKSFESMLNQRIEETRDGQIEKLIMKVNEEEGEYIRKIGIKKQMETENIHLIGNKTISNLNKSHSKENNKEIKTYRLSEDAYRIFQNVKAKEMPKEEIK